MNDIIYKHFTIKPTVNGFRISRTDNTAIHCHMKHKSACLAIADYISLKKVPTNKGFYFLSCLVKLANDIEYKNKVQSLIDVRTSKGRKKDYYCPRKRKRAFR